MALDGFEGLVADVVLDLAGILHGGLGVHPDVGEEGGEKILDEYRRQFPGKNEVYAIDYDNAFLPDNGALYCTELIRESYRTPEGEFIFPEKPMNWKNSEGEIPPYWTWLFGLLGMEVPQDVPGTNPHDMALLPILEDVDIDLVSLRKD